MRAVLMIALAAQGVSMAGPRAGDMAPPLALSNLPQATWSGLAGKAVLLEFWATWCGPCVKQIPHLNALSREFAGRPLAILAITDEEPAVVEKFLELRPMEAQIGFDAGGITGKAYGVTSWPRTVLVDATGRVAAVTLPERVTARTLEDLIAGRPLSDMSPPAPPKTAAQASLLEITIRPAEPSSSMSMNSRTYRARGTRLLDAIAAAWSVNADRVVCESPLPDGTYEILVDVSGSSAPLAATFQQALEQVFRLRVRREIREMDVLLLRRLDGVEPDLQPVPADLSSHSGDGVFATKGAKLSALAGVLEDATRVPIFDETALPGSFAYQFYWDEDQPKALPAELRKQLKLTLEPARKSLEVLVVSSPR